MSLKEIKQEEENQPVHKIERGFSPAQNNSYVYRFPNAVIQHGLRTNLLRVVSGALRGDVDWGYCPTCKGGLICCTRQDERIVPVCYHCGYVFSSTLLCVSCKAPLPPFLGMIESCFCPFCGVIVRSHKIEELSRATP